MIKIGGAVVEYVNDTLDIDEAIGERSTASFDCVGLATDPHFQQGQQVEVFDDVTAELIYAGVVDKPKEKYLTDAGKIHYQIDCKDWHYLADKRRIAKAYEDTYAGDIVRDILKKHLILEGVNNSKIVWESAVNVGVAETSSGFTIEKTGGTNGVWDASVCSISMVENVEYDAYVEATCEVIAGNHVMVGFNTLDSSVSYTDIDFAIYFTASSSNIRVYEYGLLTYTYNILWSVGDRLKVALESGVIKYYHNDFLFYTSLQSPTFPLKIDTAFYEVGSKITNVVFYKEKNNTIQNGPNITEAVFNYVKVTDAIEALAEKAGFIWYIDENKILHFRARDTNVAPWTMTRADALKNSISLEVGNPSYRNKQYIKGGRDITDPMDEFKAGDGKTRAWTTGFPIAKEPTILVNGVAVLASDVGIKSVETGKKFYWSKGDPVFIQADNQPLLTSADTIKITYQGEFDIIAITYDGDQIEQRMNIEGNSGINEDVADEMANTNREASFQSANAKIKKYAVVGKRLKFSTIRSGLKAGQLLTVNLPEHELNNAEMLIESVQISIVKDHTIYNVACAEGPEQNSWAKMFGAMATRGQAFIVRKNISEKEILIVLEQFTKTWELADSPNIFKELYANDTLYPADTLYPMFAYADRIKYIEILDNLGAVLIRKKVTKQLNNNTASILSLFFIAGFEANGNIQTLKFYGGKLATSANNSGVLIDTIAYSRLKNELEAMQIDKTDNRNFVPATGTKALDPYYWQEVDDGVEQYLANSQ